jgi:hypothetical protein
VNTIESPIISMVRGALESGLDKIPSQYHPVESIVKVFNKKYGEFKLYTDYYLSGDYISWTGHGDEPSIGEAYYIIVNSIRGMKNV